MAVAAAGSGCDKQAVTGLPKPWAACTPAVGAAAGTCTCAVSAEPLVKRPVLTISSRLTVRPLAVASLGAACGDRETALTGEAGLTCLLRPDVETCLDASLGLAGGRMTAEVCRTLASTVAGTCEAVPWTGAGTCDSTVPWLGDGR